MKSLKKSIAVLMAALLTTSFSSPVLAEIQISERGTARGEWVKGTDLIAEEGTGGYALRTVDGTYLSEPVYGGTFSFQDGFLLCSERREGEKLNCSGALTQEGEPLIPFLYGKVAVKNDRWAIGFIYEESDASEYDDPIETEDYQIIFGKLLQADVYYVQDSAAVLLASLTRDQYLDSSAQGDYLNLKSRAGKKITCYDSSFAVRAEKVKNLDTFPDEAYAFRTFKENGLTGIIDRDGEVVVPASYRTVEIVSDRYAQVSDGEKSGLIDLAGNVLLPVAFDQISRSYVSSDYIDTFCAFGYYAGEQDGHFVFWKDGGVTYTYDGPAYNLMYGGASATRMDFNSGTTILVTGDGTETTLKDYVSVFCLYESGGLLYQALDSQFQEGVIDWTGQEIIPCGQGRIAISGSGSYLSVTDAEGQAVFYQVDYGMDVE